MGLTDSAGAKVMQGFRVRYLKTDDDARGCAMFLVHLWHEVGRVKADPEAALKEIWRVINEGVAFVIERESDGAWVASMGLTPSYMWYAPEGPAYFQERWMYVLPPARDTTPCFRMMLDETRALVDHTGMAALITVFNRKRFVRGLVHEGQRLWLPAGERVTVEPSGGHDVGREHENHEHDAEHLDDLPGVDAGRGEGPVRSGGPVVQPEP